MSNTYNIYKVQCEKLDALKEKLNKSGLVEQKTVESGNFRLVFYFSEKVSGSEIWWWATYQDFFKDGIIEPKNFSYFGLLLCFDMNDDSVIYAISLGKSHFYLAKFIQPDFGIALAVRMANENAILLKKKQIFCGRKKARCGLL